jgi:hypothetical protein
MTLDELMKVYDKAASDVSFLQYEGTDHRAGIRAVVLAIRDEIGLDPGYCDECKDNKKLFREILASDGVKSEGSE